MTKWEKYEGSANALKRFLTRSCIVVFNGMIFPPLKITKIIQYKELLFNNFSQHFDSSKHIWEAVFHKLSLLNGWPNVLMQPATVLCTFILEDLLMNHLDHCD